MNNWSIRLFALWFSLLSFPSINGQKKDTFSNEVNASLKVSVLSYFTSDTPYSIDQLLNKTLDNQFEPVKQKTFNRGILRQYYWFKFSISNLDNKVKTAFIDIQNPRINELQLYEVDGKSSTSFGKSGDFFNFETRTYLYKNFVFSSTIPGNSKKVFYLYVNQVGHSFMLPLKVYNYKEIQSKIMRDYLVEGIALGILVYIIILSLLYWVTRKEKIYFIYSIYILSAIGWVLSYFGLGFQLIWPMYPSFNTAAAPLFSGIHMILNIQLCQTIVQTKMLSRLLNHICNATKIILLIIAVLPFLTSLDNLGIKENEVYLNSFLIIIILSVVMVLTSIIFSLKKRNNSRYYLYSNIIKVSGILNLALMELGLTPGMYNLEQIMVGGLLIEVFLLSFGLAKRSQLQNIRLRKQQQASREMEVNLHKEILKAQLEMQEQTFKAIGEEIHDNFGQMLTLLKLNLEKLKPKVLPHEIFAIDDAQKILNQVMHDLRNLSKTLNNDMLATIGISKAIEIELKAIEKVTGVQATLNWDAVVPTLAQQVELIIFRVIQEALHNILKHAKATTIVVSAKFDGNELIFSVKDNGAGFNKNSKVGTGNGLLNLDNRCKLINACLEINTSEGNGTEIRITCPLDSPPIAPTRTNKTIFGTKTYLPPVKRFF